MSADATWLVERRYGAYGEFEELADGSARFTTPYSDLAALSAWILSLGGRAHAVEPETVVEAVAADLQTVDRRAQRRAARGARSARSGRGRAARPAAGARRRGRSRRSGSRFSRRCWPSCSHAAATRPPRASRRTSSSDRFRLTPQELQESLDLLNLVNFGGGCYAVYCATENGHIHVDKELYGDTFRRPARLSPLEAKALLRALDVVAPLVAAEAHTSLATVREKVEAAFGTYALADTPKPQETDAEEHAVTILNEGVRDRRLVDITYLSRSSDEFSTRSVEPYLLRRDDRGWYVEAWDRSRDGRRTFKVPYIKEARLSRRALRAPARDGRPRPLARRRGGHRPGAGSRPSARAGSSRGGPGRQPARGRRRRRRRDATARASGWSPRSCATAARPRCSSPPAVRDAGAGGRRSSCCAGSALWPCRLRFASATRALRCRWRPSRSGTYSRR